MRFHRWAPLPRAKKGFKESSASSRSLELRMVEVVECVPNFSEGRRKDVVDAIGSAIASVAGARILDVQTDADHNRSVITFVGDRRAVSEAAFQAASAAVERIDMNVHRGEHPRVGALDVLPFVPIAGVTMVDCRRTSLVQAFEAIRALAEKEGVEIVESEIVGLVPLDALVDGATQYFKLARFHRDQILEMRLWE